MTVALPVQEFRLGQRVRPQDHTPFVIDAVWVRGGRVKYSGIGRLWYWSDDLTLAPERPPYVPSERLVVGRKVTIARYQPELYRCETDVEMAARHAAERTAYDAQGEGE